MNFLVTAAQVYWDIDDACYVLSIAIDSKHVQIHLDSDDLVRDLKNNIEDYVIDDDSIVTNDICEHILQDPIVTAAIKTYLKLMRDDLNKLKKKFRI